MPWQHLQSTHVIDSCGHPPPDLSTDWAHDLCTHSDLINKIPCKKWHNLRDAIDGQMNLWFLTNRIQCAIHSIYTQPQRVPLSPSLFAAQHWQLHGHRGSCDFCPFTRDDKKCFQFIEQTLWVCNKNDSCLRQTATISAQALATYGYCVLPPGCVLFDFSHCESRRWIPIYWIESATDVGAVVVVVVSGWWFQIGNS